MIEKIKQNPIKVLGIAAGIFFLAAILFMLLPGLTYSGKFVDEESGVAYNMIIRASLFAFAFAGKVFFTSGSATTSQTMRNNGMTLCPIFLFIVAVILAIILLCGLFKGKFSNRKKIVLLVIICVLVFASAIIIFISKESMIQYAIAGPNDMKEYQELFIKQLKQNGKFSLGAGAILSPIMMLLGAGSLVGAVVLSNKKTK